jgi:hypothetical protein
VIRWLIRLPVWLVIVVVRYPAALIAIWLFSSLDRRHLVRWCWLETIDNDLSGDTGWKQEHIAAGSDPLSSWNRIRWLWRNGGNRFNYEVIGCRNIGCIQIDAFHWANTDGFWLYRRYVPFAGRLIDLYFGWSLTGPQKGRCKFVCQVRLKKNL